MRFNECGWVDIKYQAYRRDSGRRLSGAPSQSMMGGVMALLLFSGGAFPALVSGHAYIASPMTRDQAAGLTGLSNPVSSAPPTYVPDYPCRAGQPRPPTTTIVPGQWFVMQTRFDAKHGGICALFISTNETYGAFAKVLDMTNCNQDNYVVNVPDTMQATSHAVLKWQWIAAGSFWVNCIDVAVANGSLLTPMRPSTQVAAPASTTTTLSPGATAGVVVGTLFGVAAVALAAIVYVRRQRSSTLTMLHAANNKMDASQEPARVKFIENAGMAQRVPPSRPVPQRPVPQRPPPSSPRL
ncbi:unnamed protein product (mitochondrion) [Plasmodiophora brassicae]|uniref:Chitin-binding type-4 domain-containing protein n=1 Tax=Plasmodiophora brassicae TaxID=37360 RepID=A0A0G4J8E7_PLABS|nr:hypothetical protein PBRA_003457 [Plasmodiophora brassicae]SPQ99810.1 unnamed protein product [Plasmodiophora brassicae]